MVNEVLYGGLDGFTGGAQAGSAFGPWGTAIGGLAGGALGAFHGKSSKKARRKAEQRLQETLQKLMSGSSDAFGNTLSADNTGRWSYKLNNAGINAKKLAEQALLSAGNYKNKTPQQLADQNALMQALAEVNAKKVAQSAVARSNLRTGSDMSKSLANIARQSTEALRNAILQGRSNAANSQLYNANMRNNLANNIQNAMIPINSMQNNLQSMVKGLNLPTSNLALGVAGNINSMNNPNNYPTKGTFY